MKRYKPTRILVTGGLGFVGYHLCQALLSDDPNVVLTIVDNLSSTRLDYQSLVGRAQIHIGDLRSFSSNGAGFDEIYHLASPVGSLRILKNHGYVATDILELAQAASELAATNSAKLLYLSSSEVYGRNGQHAESADQIVPNRRGTRMEYALGKLTAEHMLLNLADNHQHSIRVIRPFNVIGPWQSDDLGFVVPAFFKAALTDNTLLVHGDGQQTRSFCAVADLVTGLIAIQNSGHPSAVYNVGNPHNKTTILNLARKVRTICGSSSMIECIDPADRYGANYLEAYNKMPDIAKATEDAGWTPELSLQAILASLHEHFREISSKDKTASTIAKKSIKYPLSEPLH